MTDTDRLPLVSANERLVLNFLADSEFFHGFDTIAHETRLNRLQVRVACRTLTDKGFARWAQTLWDDDGKLAGSGYGATPAGREIAEPHVERGVSQ